jgi:hypothetical protein
MKKKLAFLGLMVSLAPNSFAGVMGASSDDGHKYFIGGEAIYGTITNFNNVNTPYVNVYDRYSGNTESYLPTGKNNWGFRIIAGYALNHEGSENIEASYLYLNNNGNAQTSGAELTNTLTIVTPIRLYNGSANAQTYYQYQTAQLNKTSQYVIKLLPSITHGIFYGIRGTYLKNGVNAFYQGEETENDQTRRYANNFYFSKEIYGIGPQIGERLLWSIMPSFGLGGDLSAGLLFGNQRSRLNQNTLVPTSPSYYGQGQSSAWAALLFSGQVFASFNYPCQNEQSLRIDGGIGGDQYLSANSNTKFSQKSNLGSGTFSDSNNFTFRNVFIRLVYRS